MFGCFEKYIYLCGIIINLKLRTMKLERCQNGDRLMNCNGQHGNGIYFYKKGDICMRKYYSQYGDNFLNFTVDDDLIMDCSKMKLDYWQARQIIYNNSEKYKCFIFRHQGIGIPNSKEYLVIDTSILKSIIQK